MPPKKTKGGKTKEEEQAIFGEMEERMEMIEGEITNLKTTMETMRIKAEASRL
ncbi:retrotransposon-related protein [Sesbania bispinosa]|nr:retrotransposon-related protein [Sesbania bispinosa]